MRSWGRPGASWKKAVEMGADNDSVADVNRRFTSRIVNLKIALQPHAWHPPTDLFETGQEYTIRIEIAGMHEDGFSISYMDDAITIIGRRPPFNPKCAYHRMEIPYGEFTASVQVPEDADPGMASAEYDNGFLTITIPKSKAVDIKINKNEG